MTKPTSDAPHVTGVEKPADCTTGWDHVVLFRVRHRLAAHGLRLELHSGNDGWRWAITGHDLPVPHIFGSLHLALSHADAYTAAACDEPPLGAYSH